jgi:NhaP-type Na+/H+ or K+/H+ antiporter
LFAAAITAGIFILRWVFFIFLLGSKSGKLIWFAPRGLITILLFLSIPEASRIELINEEVVTLVILMSIFVMMIGNMIPGRKGNESDTTNSLPSEYSQDALNPK